MTKTPSQMGKFRRAKGVRWEQECARVFNRWLGVDCECKRTPLSGGYGAEWNLGGDLMFDRNLPIYAELKNDESWKLEQVFLGKGPIPGWWAKAEKEAGMWNKRPLLIITRNFVAPMVMFVPGQWEAQEKPADVTAAVTLPQSLKVQRRHVLLLSDFFQVYDPPPAGERRGQGVSF